MEINLGQVIVQIICFITLFFILRIFAWGKLLAFLDERRDRIAKELSDIENAKSQADQLKSRYDQKLKDFDSEKRSFMEEALKESRKIGDVITAKAKEDADKIILHAKASASYEIARAREELKTEIVDIVIKATENLIEEKMTEEQDKKIVGEFIDKSGDLK